MLRRSGPSLSLRLGFACSLFLPVRCSDDAFCTVQLIHSLEAVNTALIIQGVSACYIFFFIAHFLLFFKIFIPFYILSCYYSFLTIPVRILLSFLPICFLILFLFKNHLTKKIAKEERGGANAENTSGK